MLDRIESYYDTVPRSGSGVEEFGSLRLFVSHAPWPYYGRPSGAEGDRRQDLERLLTRQSELGIRQSLEWVEEVTPWLAREAEAAGLEVSRCPLMVLDEPFPVPAVDGIEVRIATPDDAGIPAARAAVDRAFGGTGDSDAAVAAYIRERIRDGAMAMAIAESADGPVASGSVNPRGEVAELVAIGTLPDYQRRGIGLAVTAALVGEVRRQGVELVFLSAGGEEVARIYERAGFRRIAHACIAEHNS